MMDLCVIMVTLHSGKNTEEGNTPEPAPEPPTPQQKLEAAGLTIEELKEALGL